MKTKTPEDALERAIEKAGRKEIAAACGITPETTYKWKVVPAHHCIAVETASGVPRAWLRPDVYGEVE